MKRLAKASHSIHSQFKLAFLCQYACNGGMRKDLKAAFEWALKAANGRHKMACARVGKCLYLGEVVAQSYKGAKRWLELAPDNAKAPQGLGPCTVRETESREIKPRQWSFSVRLLDKGFQQA